MLDQPFEVNGILGKIKRRNPAMQSFESALYTKKLLKMYPGVSEDVKTALSVTISKAEDGTAEAKEVYGGDIVRPDINASIAIAEFITKFCGIAPRIVDVQTDVKINWPRAAKASPEQIDAMFQFWLEREDFRDKVNEVIETLDYPNGKAGASVEMLEPADLDDPLSVQPALNSSMD